MHTYMMIFRIYSDMHILGTMIWPAARLLACSPVRLSAGRRCITQPVQQISTAVSEIH